MILCSIQRRFSGVLLCILLTVVALFSAVNAHGSDAGITADRKATVKAAFEGFYGLLYFLSSSDRFLNSMTADEKRQFNDLGQLIVEHVTKLAPASRPVDNKTSSHVNFKLKFSDYNEDFILPDSKEIRTAKFDGNVWFNLNIINNPTHEFGLLQAIQILFHEFGHALPDAKKDQKLIDDVAAKIHLFLKGFYREASIKHPTSSMPLKMTSLSLPYLVVQEGAPVDYQFEPIVLFEREGKTFSAELDVISTWPREHKFTPNDYQTIAFTRMVLNPSIEARADGVSIEWSIETRNFLVDQSRAFLNYVFLYTDIPKAEAFLPLAPTIHYKKQTQLIPWSQFDANFSNGQMLPLKNTAELKEPYAPSFDQRWLQKLHVARMEANKPVLKTVIEYAGDLREVHLLASAPKDYFQFPGTIKKMGSNIYELEFALPEGNPQTNTLIAKSLVLNSEKLWELEKTLPLSLNIGKALPMTPKDIQIWDGKSWISILSIKEAEQKTDAVKMRFVFANRTQKIHHVEIKWIMVSHVYRDQKNISMRMGLQHEVFAGETLIQTFQGSDLVVEMKASKTSFVTPEQKGKPGFIVRDSKSRAIYSIHMVDESLNTVMYGTKLVPTWKSIFSINGNYKPAMMCNRVFVDF